MRLDDARHAKPTPRAPELAEALGAVSAQALAATVRVLAHPRDFRAEPAANRRVGGYIADRLRAAGYDVTVQGEHRNVVALPRHRAGEPLTLVGAHYDSVPGSPGADDNASAVAGLIAGAEAAAGYGLAPVGFVAFNREEQQDDHGGRGLIGSTDFVRHFLPAAGVRLRAVHVLEMIGYRSGAPGSQKTPPGLPIALPNVGDFIGVVGNAASAALVGAALSTARSYVPSLPVLGLTLPPGAEDQLPVLQRSDHGPFWKAGIPALQWTDTAEFRNPHYHDLEDTPDTLDYAFLAAVTRAVLACALSPGG